ncbi:MAG TPA: peptidylprolyl isomerase [Sphingobium sp.]
MQSPLFRVAIAVMTLGSFQAPAISQDHIANALSTAPSTGTSPATDAERTPTATEIAIARMLRAGTDLSWLLSPEEAATIRYSPEQLVEARSIIGLARVAKARSLDRSEDAANVRSILETVALAEVARRSLLNSIRVSDEDIADRLAKQPGRYDEYRLSHIFVAIGPDRNGHIRTENQARTRASQLYAQLAKGADFATLAKSESDDLETAGDGGTLSSLLGPYMAPEFFPDVHVLKTGETSKPIHGTLGYHIVRLDERIAATAATARYLITNDIQAERMPALIGEAISEAASSR